MFRNLVLLSVVFAVALAQWLPPIAPLHTFRKNRPTDPPNTDSLLVKSALGYYRGFNYVTKNGDDAEIFLGIPFAQPPVGELRFEKPLPILPHNGVFNATKFSPICIPHTRLAVTPGLVASEDCLTLNIIRPKPLRPTSNTDNSQEKFPVLVWIHGGGYEIGSAPLFGYSGLADNYVPEGIIVVTFQYRLGIHGYLATGSKYLKGNYGSFDQVLAFKWLYNNIAAFGGDPKKITAWGLSAGGCSAAEIALSDKSSKYVVGAIEMSGSAFSYWGTGTTVYENSHQYIAQLGCPADGKDMKKCLKQKTVDELYNAVDAVGYTTQGLDTIKWGPVVDGDFMKDSPFKLAKTAPPKPIIVGAGDKDTGYFGVLGYSPFIQNLSIPVPVQQNFTRDALASLITRLIKPTWFGPNRDLALQKMLDRYAPVGQSVAESVAQYLRWTNEMYFYRTIVDGILARRKNGWKIWAYEFKQFNPIIYQVRGVTTVEAMGSVHTNEYAYMFELFNMGPYAMTGNDGIVHKQIVAAISSFTKSQVPIIPGKYWPQVGTDMNYWIFEGEGQLAQNYFMDAYNFMGELTDLGFDLGFLSPTVDVDRS